MGVVRIFISGQRVDVETFVQFLTAEGVKVPELKHQSCYPRCFDSTERRFLEIEVVEVDKGDGTERKDNTVQ